jgi:predicted dehydrogenase
MVRNLINNDEIGELKLIQSSFSFFDDNPESIVNKKEYGGGSLFDIGCYPVSASRLIFNDEPESILAEMYIQQNHGVDISTTCTLEFKNGKSQFFSSIGIYENQNVKIFGTKGIIEIPIPFNPPNNKESEIILIKNNDKEIIKIDQCSQYEIEVSSFSNCILNDKNPPISLIDSLNNMIVIDKIFESAKIGKKVFL